MKSRWQIKFIVLNLILVFLLLRYTSDIIYKESNRNAATKRFSDLMDNFWEIKKSPEKKVLFLGTSTWQYFLNPINFDHALKEGSIQTESYNLSFAGALGAPLTSLVYRIKSEMDDQNNKFGLTVIELNPVGMAREFHLRNAAHLNWSLSRIFFDWKMWINLILDAPVDSVYHIINQYVRPPDIYDFMRLLKPQKSDKKESSLNLQRPGVASLWNRGEFKENKNWNRELRGLNNWNLPTSEDLFRKAIKEIHQPENWNLMVQEYADRHGVNQNFSFDSKTVDMFIDSVRVAKKFSKNVYIVLFQTTPDLQKNFEKYADISGLVKRVETETGVKVLDYRKSFNVTNEDFADAEHAHVATVDKWLNLLAKQIIEDNLFKKDK